MKKVSFSKNMSKAGAQSYDVPLLLAVLFLVGIGMVMVYSASSALAAQKFHSSYYFLKRQGIFFLFGVLALVICRYVPYRLYRAFTYPLLLLSLLLLAAVHLPGLEAEAGGASRWLRIGPLKFQPSELARLALIIYLAYSLEKKQALIERLDIGFIPHVAVLFIFSALLLTQPDFGSVVIFGVLTWIMLFTAGVKISHLSIVVIPLILIAIYIMYGEAYRIERIRAFFKPWENATGSGYQMIHSFMAFGTGGIIGAGLGRGYQKLFYLPEPHTDFIFSVIGEELGLVGVLIIIFLYATVINRGISIAQCAGDLFGNFLAMGIISAIGLQVCINMGVALGLLPTKGLTLPFLSYGGTSLLMNMASIGILLNIAADKKKNAWE